MGGSGKSPFRGENSYFRPYGIQKHVKSFLLCDKGTTMCNTKNVRAPLDFTTSVIPIIQLPEINKNFT